MKKHKLDIQKHKSFLKVQDLVMRGLQVRHSKSDQANFLEEGQLPFFSKNKAAGTMGLWCTTGKPRFFCKIDYDDDKKYPINQIKENSSKVAILFIFRCCSLDLYQLLSRR